MAKAATTATKRTAVKKTAVKKSAGKKSAGKKSVVKKAVTTSAAKKPATTGAKPRLLAGGNPQIAKGHGEAPVAAYLAALPGWKRPLGERLDALVTRVVPGVRKAVKYNSPLYGLDGATWFLGLHGFERYLKLAFFKGAHLTPLPPVASKQKEVRYLHLHEGEEIDEKMLGAWLQQASKLPGEKL